MTQETRKIIAKLTQNKQNEGNNKDKSRTQ